jgi:hypothetical protein
MARDPVSVPRADMGSLAMIPGLIQLNPCDDICFLYPALSHEEDNISLIVNLVNVFYIEMQIFYSCTEL